MPQIILNSSGFFAPDVLFRFSFIPVLVLCIAFCLQTEKANNCVTLVLLGLDSVNRINSSYHHLQFVLMLIS